MLVLTVKSGGSSAEATAVTRILVLLAGTNIRSALWPYTSLPFSLTSATPQSDDWNGGFSISASICCFQLWAWAVEMGRMGKMGRMDRVSSLANLRPATCDLRPLLPISPILPILPILSIIRHPWIHFRIDQVRDEVHKDKHKTEKQDAALDGGQVPLFDGRQHIAPDTGPGEDRLGQDGSGEIAAEVEPDDGDHRQQRVAEPVRQHHRCFPEPLGSGRANEVAPEHFLHGCAGHPGEERYRTHAQRDGRQHQEGEPAVPGCRKPPQSHRKPVSYTHLRAHETPEHLV